MKKTTKLMMIAALTALSACNGGKNAINKDELQGRYQMDMSSMVTSFIQEELTGKKESDAMSVASMFLSQLEVTVQFESEKAIIDASGAIIGLLQNMSDKKMELPMVVEYKIENDSVLYFKQEGKNFEEAGVLKKLGDSYDYLKFSTTQHGKYLETTLKKIK